MVASSVEEISISKNTAAMDKLLLKFRVTWSASLIIAVSFCDFYGNQTDFPEAVWFIGCAFG
jgi:hypothetical protein